LIGQTISNYRVVEKLRSGGVGMLHKAEDIKLHLFMAREFLPDEVAKTPKLYTVGLARKASLRESTAIPEVFEQVYQLVQYLVKRSKKKGSLALITDGKNLAKPLVLESLLRPQMIRESLPDRTDVGRR
jgi:hypothetical protein